MSNAPTYRGKIKPEHIQPIAEAMRKVMRDNPDARAKYAGQGLSDKRFRWDVFRAARHAGDTDLLHLLTDDIYPYANDEHMDTLLRWIVQ